MNDGTLTFDNLLCDVRGPIATVTLNRPKVLNALDAATFDDLESVFATLAAQDSVRVILLTGAGEKAFAAGADINELAAADGAAGQKISERGQQVFLQIENCGKPVIACVNGFALGGGCELALACTLRIAADTAKFGQPEAKLGLLPGYGASQRLPRLVGPGNALYLLLTAEIVTAQEALRIGLVSQVHPAAELMPAAIAIAEKIAALSPLAIKETIAAVNQGAALPLPQALAIEARLFGKLCATADKNEGTAAFLEKRKPTWQNR